MKQLAQALTKVRELLGEAQRLAAEAKRAGVQATMSSAGQVEKRERSLNSFRQESDGVV